MKQLFLTSAADQVLGDIVKKLPKKPAEYNVAFINTAAEGEDGNHWWVSTEKNKFIELGFISIHEFTITNLTNKEIENKLTDKEIIYFCGGNTFYLLNQVIKTGCDEIIKRKVEEGIIFIGSSAGSKIFGNRLDLVYKNDEKNRTFGIRAKGLEIIDMAILPHWGSEDFKEKYKNAFETMYIENTKITLLTNQQYLWVNGDSIQLVSV